MISQRFRLTDLGKLIPQVNPGSNVVQQRVQSRTVASMENDLSLRTEGDINFSPARKSWYASLDHETLQSLESDSESFLHQSLSTPCLNSIVSCNGIWITDQRGRKYMDFHGNSVHQIGYGHPKVIARVKEALDVLPFSPRRYTNPYAIQLSHQLLSLLPPALGKVLFCPGGTSAIGMALKLARRITGRYQVVSFRDSFHGASLDAIAAGGEAQFKLHMGPVGAGNITLPQPCQDSRSAESDAALLEATLEKNPHIGAMVAETIRNTDVRIPGRDYWKAVREICDRHKVLLILDEIPTAFGRTGTLFAFEHFDIVPDILCLGKGLGAGAFPLAAMVCRREFDVAQDISLGHYTHEKSPVGCAAASAMLDVLEEEHLLQKAKDHESFLRVQLQHMKDAYRIISAVRGIGMLWGIELSGRDRAHSCEVAEQVMYACLERGLSFKVSQGNVIQWCPPLIIRREELNDALHILQQSLEEVVGTADFS